jgi:S1-C subfamily serine protease
MSRAGETGSATRIRGAFIAVFLLAGCSTQASAQATAQAATQPITPEEQAAIEIGRRGARMRPVLPRKPLDAQEASRVKIFKASKPSVVYIASATQRYVLLNQETGDTVAIPPGTGTGFIWDDQGHVVTNYHVVMVDVGGAPLSEAEDLQVTLADGKTYRARVIGKSLAYDIAVLRVFAPLRSVKPLPLGTSKELQVGQTVLAIGNPFGLDHTLTQGIISGLRKEVITDSALQRKIRGAIQTDAAINPGNSGGPLLDSSGRVIGMNTSIKSKTGYNAGVSFAIPVDTLNRVVPLLIAKGQLERPELGFSGISNQLATLLGVTKGVVVGGVVPDSIADRAGLKGWKIKEGDKIPTLGDIIVGFQGRPIDNEVQLLDLLELEQPDAPLAFEVLREGKRLVITMRPGSPTLGEAPAL